MNGSRLLVRRAVLLVVLSGLIIFAGRVSPGEGKKTVPGRRDVSAESRSKTGNMRSKAREVASFGLLQSVDVKEAKRQALAWLNSVKKEDATLKKFEAVWATDKPTLDKVVATLTLGNSLAARLLADARDAPAPTKIPAILKDEKQSTFFRANLALAYGKALVGRKVYEEALESLLATRAEDVVDPAAYPGPTHLNNDCLTIIILIYGAVASLATPTSCDTIAAELRSSR